jgi:nicotinamide-nucleotide amidase
MAGFTLEHLGVPWYFLPGVPWEMKELTAQKVLPDLERRFPDRPVYRKRVMRFQGLSESTIGARLEDMAGRPDLLGVEIGYLPQTAENWVTLLATAQTEEEALRRIERAAEEVLSRLGRERLSGEDGETIELVVGRLLRERNWKLALAESCTAGLLSSKVASVGGASDYLDRAFVTYGNGAKVELLGVPESLLAAHGAVSEPVAEAMARGARERAGVDAALAITGIAGPTGGSPEKPVGTVFIACADARGCEVEKKLFGGGRDQVRERAAHAALVLLWRRLSR